jgi:hypothetical protein
MLTANGVVVPVVRLLFLILGVLAFRPGPGAGYVCIGIAYTGSAHAKNDMQIVMICFIV